MTGNLARGEQLLLAVAAEGRSGMWVFPKAASGLLMHARLLGSLYSALSGKDTYNSENAHVLGHK